MKNLLALILLFAFFISHATAQAKEITLKWKAIEGAKKYSLEVAKDSDFSDVVFSKTVKENSFPKELPSGKYYLRVRGIDSDDFAGKWSSPFKLVVTAPVDPVEKVTTPKQMTFVGKAPRLDASWKVDDKATNFKVQLLKDGKEVQTAQTTQPKADFHPKEAGNYKIVVSSGYDGVFGPPVTVEEINIEQKELTPPKAEMPPWKKYDSRHSINVKWMPSPPGEAKSYVVNIYKAKDFVKGNWQPASTPVATFHDLNSGEVNVPALPPGRYVAAVQAVSSDDSLSTATMIPMDVNRGKPVEIEKFDLSVGYGVTGIDYESNLIEAGNPVHSGSIGSAVSANGNLWLYDSSWGLRVGGSWNSFITGGNTITYSDLMIAGQYRYIPSDEGLRKEFKPYLGFRAWNMPIVIPNGNSNNGNNGNTSSAIQELSTTALGPVAGLEYIRPLSEKIALVGGLQISFPITASPVVGGGPVQSLASSEPSAKIQLGAKVAIPGGMRLLAMLGMESDQVAFTPFAGYSGTGTPPPGAQDKVNINYPSVTLGIETASDGNIFRSNTLTAPPPEIFSNIDFTASYAVASTNYNGSMAENFSSNNNGAGNFSTNGSFGAAINFEAQGFFKDSHSGLRLNAGWNDFSYNGTTIVNPEFEAQWSFRPRVQEIKSQWNWNNYLGMRLWRVPIMEIQSTFFDAQSPQMLGPVDTFILTKGLGNNWSGRFLAEVSTPVFLTDKSTVVGSVQSGAPSGRAEVAAIRALSPDLSMGLGAGFRVEQLQYAPAFTTGLSTIQMTAPTLNLFGKYSF